MEKTMNYAVIFTYNFDDEVAVYLFETEENEWHSEGTISKDGWYAKIENYYGDEGSEPAVTEFRIGNIYQ